MGLLSLGGGGGGSSSSAGAGYDYQRQLQQQITASKQSIWGPQASALTGLYGDVSQMLGRQGNMQDVAQGQVNAANPYMQAGLQGMQGIAGGGGPLAQYAKPNNELAQQQLSQLSQQIGQNFGREVLPQIRSGAGITGNMGGSRAALAQGVAAGDAASAIGRAGTDLYAAQYGIGAQAAAGQTDAMNFAASQLPGAAQASYNLGMAPYAAAWAPMTAAAGIYGSPTALSQQFGMSQGVSGGESWNKQAQQQKQKGQWNVGLF